MKTITTERAREICSHWHGGQWSALYQFASSGIFEIKNLLNYVREIEDCLHPEYNLHPGTLSIKDSNELNSLQRYFRLIGENKGVYFSWFTHPVYGYRIPEISGYNAEDMELVKSIEKPLYVV